MGVRLRTDKNAFWVILNEGIPSAGGDIEHVIFHVKKNNNKEKPESVCLLLPQSHRKGKPENNNVDDLSERLWRECDTRVFFCVIGLVFKSMPVPYTLKNKTKTR